MIQPVHTVYVPADRFHAGVVGQWGAEALRMLDAHAPDGAALAAALDLGDLALAARVRERVAAKLAREPIEDVRVDFEDGYGMRDDAEEDAAAVTAARALTGMPERPRRFGLRVKSFADGHRERSIRTLEMFLGEFGAVLPVVTFPKIVAVEHVAAFADVLERLDARLRFEIQVETVESVRLLDRIVEAAGTRLSGVHFGVFDYTAALGLPPSEQRLDHPACDHARHVLQVALAGTGVELSDGSSNVVPADDTIAAVHAAWRVHARHVGHSLRHGYRQGWDLHPAHLVSRYAAVYAHYLDGIDGILSRLRAAGRGILDEPATLRVLQTHVERAITVGALHPVADE